MRNRPDTQGGFRRIGRALLLPTAALLVTLGVSACDSILEVTDPDVVTPDALQSDAGLATLRAGALGDLAVALSGSAAGHGATPGLIAMSALMADEYDYSGTFPTRREGDTRLVQSTNGTMDGIYGNLHRARASAEATTELATEFGGAPLIESEMESVVGYAYTMFAETFCSGVPFSRAPADGGALEFGEPLPTEEMFARALTWFDRAITNAGQAPRFANLARVGKARALLGLGRIDDAAAEVASVPSDFVYELEHSTNSRRQENGLYVMSTVRRQWSVADGKGGNGLLFRSSMDPRVPWDGGSTLGQDDRTTYYNQLKFPSASAPVPLASGTEARLVEAEAAARAGDVEEMVRIHDELRAGIGLPPLGLDDPGAEELLDTHFRERAFWLFSTGHRLGDLRRLVRVYGRDVSDVFPWGEYFKGGQYSSEVTFPVPESEENNPNYAGCLDRNP